jgi:hypothetical protein
MGKPRFQIQLCKTLEIFDPAGSFPGPIRR